MKRLLLLAAMAAGVGLLPACEPGVEPCADIQSGTGYYDGDTVFLRLELGAPPCSDDYRYEAIVKESASGPRLARGVYRGGPGGASYIEYFITAIDDDPTVCVFARSRDDDDDIVDTAPDSGCVDFTVDVPPSGTFE